MSSHVFVPTTSINFHFINCIKLYVLNAAKSNNSEQCYTSSVSKML